MKDKPIIEGAMELAVRAFGGADKSGCDWLAGEISDFARAYAGEELNKVEQLFKGVAFGYELANAYRGEIPHAQCIILAEAKTRMFMEALDGKRLDRPEAEK